ncbi:hypothetical protein [Schaalia sp. lx-260]|uniref:hypothetical protein n=1 Tax=Schaalia sp. lx-260 TaxID=2899082 RepID=UPI001E554E09|nr:hypothetical protein [Schaalia sp. lx-260]MCD4549996.1 hypothetical protein [Schaalia sp. lx-260]
MSRTVVKSQSRLKHIGQSATGIFLAVALIFGGTVLIGTPQAQAAGEYNDGQYAYNYKASTDNLIRNYVTGDIYYIRKGETSPQNLDWCVPVGTVVTKDVACVAYSFNMAHERWGGSPFFWFTVPTALNEPYKIQTQTDNDEWKVYEGWEKLNAWKSSGRGRWVRTRDTGHGRINERTGESDSGGSDFDAEFNKMAGLGNYDNAGNTKNTLLAIRDKSRSIYVTRYSAGSRTVNIRYAAEVKDKNLDAPILGGINQRFKSWNMQYGKWSVTPGDPAPLNTVNEPKLPEMTEVEHANNLSSNEKTTVENKVKQANSDLITNGIIKTVTTDDNGTTTVTYADDTTDVIAGSSLVRERKPEPVVTPPDNNTVERTCTPLRKKDNSGQFWTVKVPQPKLRYTTSDGDLVLGRTNGQSEGQAEKIRTEIRQAFMKCNEPNGDMVNLYPPSSPAPTSFRVGTGAGPYSNNQLKDSRSTLTIRDRWYPDAYYLNIPLSDLVELTDAGTTPTEAPISQEERDKAKATVNSQPLLTPNEKEEFNTEIQNADTRDKINAAIDKAIKKNAEKEAAKAAFEKAKQKAREDINALRNLSPEAKKNALAAIDALTYPTHTQADIDRIVNQAKADDLTALKQKAKENLADLDQAIQDKYKPLIDQAGDAAGVEEQVQAARLEDAKNKAKAGIRELNLPADKEAEFLRNVDAATSAANAYAELEKAKAEAAKQSARDRVNATNLPQSEKDKFLAEIEAAKRTDELDNIVFRAENTERINDAINKINNYEHLNRAQKDSLISRIKYTNTDGSETIIADSAAELGNILGEAETLNTAMGRLKEAQTRAEAKKNTPAYTNAAQDKKTSFDEALDQAKAVTPSDATGDQNALDTGDVERLIERLSTAARELDGVDDVTPAVNKDALRTEVGKSNDVKASPAYIFGTDTPKQKYDVDLAEANRVLNNGSATQSEVNDALNALVTARESLDGVQPDKTALNGEIAKENATKADVKYIRADSAKKTAYDNALAEAKAVQADPNATQPTIDAARIKTENARTALDGVEADKAALNEALRRLQEELAHAANPATVAGKTQDSVAAYREKEQAAQTAKSAGETVRDNVSASDQEVADQVTAINAATENLAARRAALVDAASDNSRNNARTDVDTYADHALDTVNHAAQSKPAGLTPEAKQAYDDAIKAARDQALRVINDPNSTENAINTAVTEAKLAIDKARAQAEIDAKAAEDTAKVEKAMGHISADERAHAIQAIADKATAAKAEINKSETDSTDKVNAARDAGILAIDREPAKIRIAAAASSAEIIIGQQLDEWMRDPEKSKLQERALKAIADLAAEKKADIETAAAHELEATTVAGELAIFKEIAKTLIESLPVLDDSAKEAAKNDIATKANKAEVIESFRNLARKVIEGLTDIPEDVLARVNENLARDDGLNSIRGDVFDAESASTRVHALKAIDEKATAAKETINALEGLTPDQKKAFESEIDEAAAKAKANLRREGIVYLLGQIDDARAAGEREIDKIVAKAHVEAKPNLSEKDKKAIEEKIDEALDNDTITAAVNEADSKDKENLDKAKEEANAHITDLPTVGESDKETLKDDINKAQTIDEVNGVVSRAKLIEATAQAPSVRGSDNFTYADPEKKQAYEEAVAAGENLLKNPNATSAEIEAAITAINEAKDALNGLDNIRKDATQKVNDLSLLPQAEKDKYIERINASNSHDEITRIIKEAEEANTQLRGEKPTDEEREKAKEQIGKLTNLPESDRNKVKEDIDKAETRGEIEDIVNNAKKQDETTGAQPSSENHKEAAKAEVDALKNLSDEEKAEFKDHIDKATSTAKVDESLNDARDLNDSRNTIDDEKLLTQAKAKAKDEISKLPNLTDEEKENAKAAIDQATDLGTIRKTLDDARTLNDSKTAGKALDEPKQKAKDEITHLPNLTNEEKENAKAVVDAAGSVEDVHTAVDSARTLNDSKTAGKALDEAKQKAKDEITHLPNLTNEEKENAKAVVDAAGSVEDVHTAVESARTLNDSKVPANSDLPQIKEEAKKAIDALQNLTPEEKAAAKSEIEGATNTDEVKAAVDKARTLNDGKVLDNVKNDAKDEIEALPNLTEKEKQDAKASVDAAKNPEEIKEIVHTSRDLNDGRNPQADGLGAAKNDAISSVNTLPNLSDKEKTEAADRINAATSAEEIAEILKEMRDRNDNALIGVDKEGAKAAIDALPNLTEPEKTELKDQIDRAATVDQVKDALDKGRVLNDSRSKYPPVQPENNGAASGQSNESSADSLRRNAAPHQGGKLPHHGKLSHTGVPTGLLFGFILTGLMGAAVMMIRRRYGSTK